MRKCLEINDDENTIYKNLQTVVKAIYIIEMYYFNKSVILKVVPGQENDPGT